MLTEIRDLIVERKIISLYNLSLYFNVDERAMEKMVDLWIKKGKIKKTETEESSFSNKCKGCTNKTCYSKMVFYEPN